MIKYTIYNYVFGVCLMSVALASIVASITTLYIIARLGKFSGYLVIVASMTLCQIVYDVSFFFFPGYRLESIYSVIQIFTSFGGISVAIWTNILSVIVLHISVFHRPIDIWAYYKLFCMLSVVPATAWAVMIVVIDEDNLMDTWYNFARFGFILFNFLVYVVISINLYRLGNAEIYGPLRELSRRFKYYPICQILTRIPACFYQFTYGYGTEDYSSPKSKSEMTALLFYCLTVPAAGIAYFIVFLWMQPQAYDEFKLLIHRILHCLGENEARNSLQFVKLDEKKRSNKADKAASNGSESSSERYYYFNPKGTWSENLSNPLIDDNFKNDDSTKESQEGATEVCYSPLTESALNKYRNLDEDELCQSMMFSLQADITVNPSETGNSTFSD
jgi:hypothetical protein